ncbi:hypothetical protein Tco_1352243 [Tanacetum coccineum]
MFWPMPIIVYGKGNVKRVGLPFSISSGLQLGLEWLGEDEVSEGGGGGVPIPNGVGGSSCWDWTCLWRGVDIAIPLKVQ